MFNDAGFEIFVETWFGSVCTADPPQNQCLFVQLVASDLFVLHAHIERCEFCEVLRRKLKRVLEAQRCQLKMVRTLGQPRSPINHPVCTGVPSLP